jgi:co-chaperonin GroES (HSP10)
MNKLYATLGRMIVKESTENDVSKGGILIANVETGIKSGEVIDIFKTNKQDEDEIDALELYAEDYGTEHPTIEIGSTVFFHDNSGYKITYQGEEYKILNYSDVIAVEFDEDNLEVIKDEED